MNRTKTTISGWRYLRLPSSAIKPKAINTTEVWVDWSAEIAGLKAGNTARPKNSKTKPEARRAAAESATFEDSADALERAKIRQKSSTISDKQKTPKASKGQTLKKKEANTIKLDTAGATYEEPL